MWKRLAEAMGRPELGDDPRYATHIARGEQPGRARRAHRRLVGHATAADLEARLNEFSVPNGKIYTAPDMLSDAHFKAREAIVRLAHPTLGEFPMQNVVPKLSDTPGEVRWVGPRARRAHRRGARHRAAEVRRGDRHAPRRRA